MTDLAKLPNLLDRLYSIFAELELIAPGRRFTLDGHLVGSIGEAVAAYAYGLHLHPTGHRPHDAKAIDGRHVQVKLTQRQSVAISHPCEHLIVLQLDRANGFREAYNGPGKPIWDLVGSKADLGRQRQIGLNRLKEIARDFGKKDRVKQRKAFPSLSAKARKGAA